MSSGEWARYMLECVFEVWFKVFSASIVLYPPPRRPDMVKYASHLLNTIKKKVSSHDDLDS